MPYVPLYLSGSESVQIRHSKSVAEAVTGTTELQRFILAHVPEASFGTPFINTIVSIDELMESHVLLGNPYVKDQYPWHIDPIWYFFKRPPANPLYLKVFAVSSAHLTSRFACELWNWAIANPKERRRRNRTKIEGGLRFRVFKRDGYRCQLCGATAQDARLHVDHKIPNKIVQSNHIDNLWTLCEPCNQSKSDANL